MWWEPYDVCKLETHHKFEQFDILSLPRVKSIATRVQMGPHPDHILELAHFENSYDSDYTKCWEICLLTLYSQNHRNYFFPHLSQLAGIEGTAFHTACMKCVERIGLERSSFRVWGWRRRVGSWGRWEKDIGPHFTNWEEKTQLDYLFIYLFSVHLASFRKPETISLDGLFLVPTIYFLGFCCYWWLTPSSEFLWKKKKKEKNLVYLHSLHMRKYKQLWCSKISLKKKRKKPQTNEHSDENWNVYSMYSIRYTEIYS
jgi:hypothetical protein